MGYKLKLAGTTVALGLAFGAGGAAVQAYHDAQHRQEVAKYTHWYNCHKRPTADCRKAGEHNPLDDIKPVDPLAIPKPATLPPVDSSTGPLPPAEYFGDSNGRPL